MKNIFLALLVLFVIAGCSVTDSSHSNQKGTAETSISNVQPDEVIGAITDEMLNRGYNTKESGNRLVVFEKPADSFMQRFVFGSKYDGLPYHRVSYNINYHNNITRVVASFAMITNPGSAFEKVTALNTGTDAKEYQIVLNNIKQSFSRR